MDFGGSLGFASEDPSPPKNASSGILNVNQKDVVTDLRHCISLNDSVERRRDILGRDAKLAGLCGFWARFYSGLVEDAWTTIRKAKGINDYL